MLVVDIINKFLNKVGAQLVRYPYPDHARRIKLLETFNINKVLDVGANNGGYGKQLRKIGYAGDIISFEPIESVFNELQSVVSNYSHWKAFNFALGDEDSENYINISKAHASSSILPMLKEHTDNSPESKYVGKEKIKIKALDSIFEEITHDGDEIFLKIDTQGYEKKVLRGSAKSLEKIVGLQIEMSLISLYENDITYLDMINNMEQLGFRLFSIENGFSSPKNGRLLQADGIFFRY